MKKISGSVFALILLASVSSAGINFDQGVNMKKFTEQTGDVQAVPAAKAKYMGDVYYSNSCQTFTFTKDSPAVSDQVMLTSTEYIEECENVGGVPPYTGGSPICHTRPGATFTRMAQVSINGQHNLLPWETEKMDVCLMGPWSSLRINQAAYEYKSAQTDQKEAAYELTPLKKIATNPDPGGLVVAKFEACERCFELVLADKWVEFYPGEKISISFHLKKANNGWFDSTVLSKDMEYDTSADYGINFATLTDISVLHGKYYVEYEFKRIGNVSTGKAVSGKTGILEIK